MTVFPSHRQRRGLFDRPTTVTLTNIGLDIAADGRPSRSVPFAAIRSIRLLHEPSRKHPDLYQCVVSTRDHGRIIIQNRIDIPFGNKIANDESYLTLVFALHNRLKLYGDNVRYRAGKHLIGYAWNVLFFVLAAAFCLLAIGTFGRFRFSGSLLHAAIAIGISLPIAVLFLFRSRPRAYRPPDLPDELLPRAGYYKA